MKYTLESECAPCGFEEFAQKHGLELVVKEREPRYFVAPNAWQ